MRAVAILRHGGPEVLEWIELPRPVPSRGEVLVRVAACGLNHLDVWTRRGIPGRTTRFPHVLGNEPVGIVMMDHPSNPRYPTYWHSRGYGLHSINPFGLHDYLNDKTQNGGMVIEPGQHVRFRYRVVIHPGLDAPELAKLHTEFAKTQ